ncbi:hypothetical protein FQA39_LY01929 [Lamprigera yunnana]|nr:hypothetical protein FQA39_LY01929 [Lamprigera yunnana]
MDQQYLHYLYDDSSDSDDELDHVGNPRRRNEDYLAVIFHAGRFKEHYEEVIEDEEEQDEKSRDEYEEIVDKRIQMLINEETGEEIKSEITAAENS